MFRRDGDFFLLGTAMADRSFHSRIGTAGAKGAFSRPDGGKTGRGYKPKWGRDSRGEIGPNPGFSAASGPQTGFRAGLVRRALRTPPREPADTGRCQGRTPPAPARRYRSARCVSPPGL